MQPSDWVSCPKCDQPRRRWVTTCWSCDWVQGDPHTARAFLAALPKPALLPNPDDHPFIKHLDATLVLK